MRPATHPSFFLLQALLLPTPVNLNPIHVPSGDLLHFIGVQQFIAAQLGIKLPLLNGTFVLVPTAQLRQQPSQQLQAGGLGSSSNVNGSSSGSDSSAMAAAIPWRLRQVSAVEVAPIGDPADATVVLVGGDRVRAGAVQAGWLTETPEYEVSWGPRSLFLLLFGFSHCEGNYHSFHVDSTEVQ
jgi:hypothetical protein